MDMEESRARLEEARERFVHELTNHIHLYDISGSVGRLYGTILFAENPMTLDEMAEKTGMSKTSMSTGVRALSEANMVEKTWRKGVRKDLYQTDPDWYKAFATVFIKRWAEAAEMNQRALLETKAKLEQLIQEEDLEKEVQEQAAHDLEKLSEAEAFYDWLNEVTNLFESEAIYSIIPKRTKESPLHRKA
ncbi:GbsR/MarR family transcriptional regulator [Alkalicoccus urumqiensis]|uniref:HTH-type transcriptional regulator n=1 Tax=Alkalicoccus urumqiensis TaxID=1548213 RepID=A0A2P6MHY6_ALKUR|nr:GbsR/MarR family transcriptional regulator [Alkalicoccus urumqiensis]PRO65909.1 GbsR/MarR family transcriptional regulator [Alkalicoccus urumqiensis]